MKKLTVIFLLAAAGLLFAACAREAEGDFAERDEFLEELDLGAVIREEMRDDEEDVSEAAERIGGIIRMGNNLGLEEDVERNWIILSVRGRRALVLSEHVIMSASFSYDEATWENSNVRSILNDTIFYNAFDEEEQSRIIETVVSTPDNPLTGTPGGNDSVDRLFLLSLEEVERYMGEETPLYGARMAHSVNLLRAQYESWWPEGAPTTVSWWLRAPGAANSAALVRDDGRLSPAGEFAFGTAGVRPAMWIYLD